MTTKHEFGTAFLVDSKYNHLVINFTPINERLCTLRIKGRFFNYSLINIHAPTNDSERRPKINFMNSWSEQTNENGIRLIDFAAYKQMAIKSTYFMYKRINLET
jgi:hypothetical protein